MMLASSVDEVDPLVHTAVVEALTLNESLDRFMSALPCLRTIEHVIAEGWW